MKKNRLSLAFLGLLIAASPLRAQDTPQTETAEQKGQKNGMVFTSQVGYFYPLGGFILLEECTESWSFL